MRINRKLNNYERMEEEMKALIMRFFRNEEGEIAVEWAVLAGLIALVIVVGVTLLGTQLNALFNGIGLWIQGTLIPSIP